jgi:AcrR family transcriptional regulator
VAGRLDRGRRRRARPRAGGGDPAEEDQLSSADPAPARRSGRRPGNPDTRDAVLAAARAAFAEKGFDGATIRGIASAAGVDPALVHHYFGNKDKLFLAAIEAPANPAELLPEVLAGGRDNLGENVVRLLLRVWDGPMRPAALALVRSAVGNEWTARLLREFLVSQVLRRVVGTLGLPTAEREARGSLAASQLIGLVMARYVLKVEPLASATPESLVAAIGPTVQRYLTGDVELPRR